MAVKKELGASGLGCPKIRVARGSSRVKTFSPNSVFQDIDKLSSSNFGNKKQRGKRSGLTKDLVQKLYYGRHMDSNEIGSIFGISGVAVRERMERWGLPRMPRGPKRVRRAYIRCLNCGTFLRRTLSALKMYRSAFCNQKCHGQWVSQNLTGANSPTYGYHHSLESIEKNRAAAKHRWKNPKWQILMSEIGRKRWESFSYQQRQSEAHRERWKDPQYRGAQLKASRKKWRNPRFRERQIRAILEGLSKGSPNKKELKLLNFLQEYGLPYRFVGDGSVLFDGRNPDFINTDGQKKLIELYGDHWHRSEKRENGGDGGMARKAIFQKFGYQTLIIWEHELEDGRILLEKIITFHRRTK